MRWTIPSLIAVIGLPTLAFAQNAEVESGTIKDRDETYLKSIDDLDVVNADGTRIGEIDDVLIDTNGVPVSYVIEVGGFLGIGDRDAQVPIAALAYENGVYVSKMTRAQLENLPKWED